ncbi:hypothetical protein F3Y22_tig00111427pilonHSYRG00047 [Hibiscus syriacus]|uniref:SAM-dependent MTase DRM-type domain-containing protein n=1 Tax=Hibiscus syriacus TaxID=106335 RepID=A0A6A2YKT1_HIBSY|nr:hypothetical protein F3Y22_tig00111427pilonHSYRG00047 [Hibiscus syriacus]
MNTSGNVDADLSPSVIESCKGLTDDPEALKISCTVGLTDVGNSLLKLTDFICAAQMAKAADALLPVEDRKPLWFLPNQIIKDAIRPPYFYYENVTLAIVSVWTKMSWYLYNVEPEFVDSNYFCTVARKRGYIHNLPIENRFPLILLPPRTIHDAFPLRKNGGLPSSVQKYVLVECRKWNLLWVRKNKVVPLKPDEVEMLLEVAFYCLIILLKAYVQELNGDRFEQLMSRFDGFDLVVDGIPCNNLIGSNKYHRDELEDFFWSLFLQWLLQ